MSRSRSARNRHIEDITRSPGITAEGVPASLQFLVEIVEQDVRQQRRQRTTLRCLFRPCRRQPAEHQSGLQVAPDQPQHPRVADLAGHARHQHVVVHPVEELLQAEVGHEAAAPGDIRHDRVTGAPPQAEAVGGLREVRIKQRHRHLMRRLLNQPVNDRRDAQKAHPATRLGDFNPTHDKRAGNGLPASLP